MQLEITTEKSSGTYGLIWGTRCFILAEKKLDMTLQEIILGIDDENVMLTLAYCALQNWLENKDESDVLPFTYVQFQNWLDEQPENIGAKIVESYMDSSYQGKTMKARYETITELLNASVDTSTGNTVKKKKSPSVKS